MADGEFLPGSAVWQFCANVGGAGVLSILRVPPPSAAGSVAVIRAFELVTCQSQRVFAADADGAYSDLHQFKRRQDSGEVLRVNIVHNQPEHRAVLDL